MLAVIKFYLTEKFTIPGNFTDAALSALAEYAIELTNETKASAVMAFINGNLNECVAELNATIAQLSAAIG